jgi:hypothetical protein
MLNLPAIALGIALSFFGHVIVGVVRLRRRPATCREFLIVGLR